jgi:hypothetical protein
LIDEHINYFLDFVKKETKSNGIRCILPNSKYVIVKSENNVRCNGYFDDEHRVLKCAINKPLEDWLPILVHEFSHFEQWKERCKIWLDYESNSCSGIFFNWVSGLEYDLALVKSSYLLIKCLELDCERRAIANIVRFKLPIDLDYYIRKSNSYVLFYDSVYLTRKWYKSGKAPYENADILSSMPSRLVGSGKKATKAQLGLFERHCY